MLKRFFILTTLFAFCLSTISCSSDDKPVYTPSSSGNDSSESTAANHALDDGVIKILAIGNSFSEDAVEQNLYDLFADAGIETVIGNLYIGGCSLQTHYNNAVANSASYSYRKVVNGSKTTTADVTMLYGIQDEDWDYITLQQSSPLSGMYSTYDPYLPYLVQYVKDNAKNWYMEIAWHQTWAYAENCTQSGFANYNNDQMTMYAGIMDASSNAVKDNNLKIIIPSGTAIQNGRNSKLGDTFNRDGYHLEYNYGRYTAACTWFETLSGIDVRTASYKPSSVSDDNKDIAVNAAHYAVLSPYQTNGMSNWK